MEFICALQLGYDEIAKLLITKYKDMKILITDNVWSLYRVAYPIICNKHIWDLTIAFWIYENTDCKMESFDKYFSDNSVWGRIQPHPKITEHVQKLQKYFEQE